MSPSLKKAILSKFVRCRWTLRPRRLGCRPIIGQLSHALIKHHHEYVKIACGVRALYQIGVISPRPLSFQSQNSGRGSDRQAVHPQESERPDLRPRKL